MFPYQHTKKIIKVPHVFEDDVRELYEDEFDLGKYLSYKGVKVFDFHPIHVYLNTENLDRYEKSREWHNCHENLIKHRFDGYGTESFLIDLIKGCK